MKSRILQLIGILVLFVIGVVLFRGCADSSSYSDGDMGEYIPPSP